MSEIIFVSAFKPRIDGRTVNFVVSRIETTDSLDRLFGELLVNALASERVVLNAGGEAYLRHLCRRMAHRDALHVLQDTDESGTPALAWLYRRARECAPSERFDAYRTLGDIALIVSGLFQPHVARPRSAVGVEYYVRMGSGAYETAAHLSADSGFGPILDELARKFARLVEVLTRVAEHTTLPVADDLAALYARFQRNPESRVLLERLTRAGAAPVWSTTSGLA